MVDLIGTLGTQHQLIDGAVARLESALERAQDTRTRTALTELQNTVSAHLGLEEVELYPLLEHAVRADPTSAEAGRVRESHQGLGEVRRAMDAFFAQTAAPDLTLEEIATAWRAVAGILQTRLAAQREAYPAFRRLTRLQRFGPGRRSVAAAPIARPA